MDTKSKNNLKFSFTVTAALVGAAAVIFLAMYPVFKQNAAAYYKDMLHSEEFLNELYRGSCVLYKDMQERVQEKELKYSDLYLQTDVKQYASTEKTDDMDYLDAGSAKNWPELSAENMEELLDSWRTSMLSGLAREIDYCVIDHETGISMTNTGRNIKDLGTDQADEELLSQYEYYVRVSFDGAGNPEKISVRGTNADELLKASQSVMKSELLQKNFWDKIRYRYGYYLSENFYYEGDGEEILHMSTSVQSTPRDTTFVYALTKDQKESLLSYWKNSHLTDQHRWDQLHAYYQAGTARLARIIFLVLGAAAVLLPRCRKYGFHRLSGAKMPLEISVLAIWIYLIYFGEKTVGLVNYTNRGYFDETYSRYLVWIPEAAYPVLTGMINFVALVLIFGVWYYLMTTLGEIAELGVREFVRERSLIRNIWRQIKGYFQRKGRAFKKEILHVDLGEKANKTIWKLVIINFLLLAAVCLIWVFGWAVLILYSLVLYFCLRKYVENLQGQYKQLLTATRSIADGNLQTEFTGDWGVFESYKEELHKIQDGFGKAVEEEVKSQKLRTELITNVSHDLKTPLTAITTYTELLKDENITSEQRREYVEVLEKKSLRLKYLIEDLFEVSKASTGNITLNLVDVDICNLMRQVYLEYEGRIEEADLYFKFRIPDEKVILQLDSQKTYRIFENLYTNIIKYAMHGTRVYINAEKTEDGIAIELKNMSATELNIEAKALTERFVRGDSARNTEGSGLGLAIVQNFVALQNGRMEIDIDGDLFKVTLRW